MISNPTKGGWCEFDFGGVGHEVGGDLGTIYVPECLANALYDYKDDSTRASDPAVEGRHLQARAVSKLRAYLAQRNAE